MLWRALSQPGRHPSVSADVLTLFGLLIAGTVALALGIVLDPFWHHRWSR